MKSSMKMFFILALAGLVFTSCKKDSETPDTFTEDQLVAYDQNQADTEADDVSNLESQIMEANDSKFNGRIASDSVEVPFDTANCAQVTIVPKGSNPTGTFTINFGSTGCLCKDGRRRKGKIISTFTNRIRTQGAEINTSYENYGVSRRGSTEFIMFDNSSTKKTITTSAPAVITDNAVLGITREVNMKVTLPAGNVFSYTGSRQMEWNLGQLQNRWDNVYITKAGSNQSGVDRKGRNYTMTVNTDLVRKAECAFIGIYKPVSGQVTISHDNKTKVVNFGDGACDNSVDVTINGKKTRTRW